MKGQVLIDFVVEFSPKNDGKMVCHVENHPWKVFMDGALNALGVRAGILNIAPEGIRLEHSFRLSFRASNNEVEYETLLAGLRAVLGIGAWDVEIYSDSQLVINQVQGNFEARDSRMKPYLQVVQEIMNKFGTTKVTQVG